MAAPSPAPTASESKWVKDFVEVWTEMTDDTNANIYIRPIPANAEEVLGLGARDKARVAAARESLGMNSALHFEVDHAYGTVFVYLNEDQELNRPPIFDLKKTLKPRYVVKPKGPIPFHHEDGDTLKEMATRFTSMLKQLVEPVAAETNIRLDAVPSADLVTEDNWYGKAVLRDVYGEYLVQKCGMPHKNIRIVTLYYNVKDDEYYYRPVVFRAPMPKATGAKKTKGRK